MHRGDYVYVCEIHTAVEFCFLRVYKIHKTILVWVQEWDLNPRLSAYEADELTAALPCNMFGGQPKSTAVLKGGVT